MREEKESGEYWEVMDRGNYEGEGYEGVGYCGWEKRMVGWKEGRVVWDREGEEIKVEG